MKPHHRVVLLLLLVPSPALLQATGVQEKKNVPLDALSEFITKYHHKPNPEAVPEKLTVLLADETLKQLSPHVFELFSHAFGHIGRTEPKLVRAYEERYAGVNDNGKEMLIRILFVCGDAETVARLKQWELALDRNDSNLKLTLAITRQFLEDPKRKLPRDRPAKVPGDLDLLWADFLITGELAPISRILDVFDQPDHLRPAIEAYLEKNTGEKERKMLFAKLGELKLLDPNNADKLVDGNLEQRLDENTLPKAIKLSIEVLGQSLESLYGGMILRPVANWSMTSNLKQHPRLSTLLKETEKDRPAGSQVMVKQWLGVK